jgi:hypothetical protein
MIYKYYYNNMIIYFLAGSFKTENADKNIT